MVEFKKNNQNYTFYTGKTINCSNWSKKGNVKSEEENSEILNEFLVLWLGGPNVTELKKNNNH